MRCQVTSPSHANGSTFETATPSPDSATRCSSWLSPRALPRLEPSMLLPAPAIASFSSALSSSSDHPVMAGFAYMHAFRSLSHSSSQLRASHRFVRHSHSLFRASIVSSSPLAFPRNSEKRAETALSFTLPSWSSRSDTESSSRTESSTAASAPRTSTSSLEAESASFSAKCSSSRSYSV